MGAVPAPGEHTDEVMAWLKDESGPTMSNPSESGTT